MGQPRRLALLGLDREEEAELGQMLAAVGSRLEPRWSVAPEADAEALLIDVDSMYGQMSWLRAQGGPRPIIALTSASRADADARLARPASPEGLQEALQAIAPKLGPAARAKADAPKADAPAPTAVPAAAPAAAADPVAPAPARQAAPSAPSPAAEAPPAPAPEPPRPLQLVDFLRGGRLPGAVRLRGAEPPLVVDPTRRSYLGGAALKPLLPLAAGEITPERWEALTPHDYDRLKGELGGEQPLSRLQWLAGLGASHGRLLPELGSALRFKLSKYPTAEREFPKHIRIATSMLKQPATPEEIAQGSGQPVEDVVDFINACAAVDLIEAEFPAPAGEPAEAAKGGLLGRLRLR